jgi:hypothetical protein
MLGRRRTDATLPLAGFLPRRHPLPSKAVRRGDSQDNRPHRASPHVRGYGAHLHLRRSGISSPCADPSRELRRRPPRIERLRLQGLRRFCTRPTRTHISLDLRAGVFSVKNKDGVTNRQVFEAVAKHWDGPASFSLGDHCFWNGFEEVAELVDGGLALDAAYYDS